MKKLAQSETRIFRSALLAFLIMSLCSIPSVQAQATALMMSGGQGTAETAPATVSSVSTF